jgi:hypothetical protein
LSKDKTYEREYQRHSGSGLLQRASGAVLLITLTL